MNRNPPSLNRSVQTNQCGEPSTAADRHTVTSELVRQVDLIASCFCQVDDLETRLGSITDQRVDPNGKEPAQLPESKLILDVVVKNNNALVALAERIGYLRERINL